MITQKQQLLLTKLQAEKPFLFASLNLEIIPSPEFKTSTAISARIDALINSFKEASNLTVAKRSVIREGIWSQGQPPIAIEPNLRSIQISSYLESLYGPKPWKFPLASAPF